MRDDAFAYFDALAVREPEQIRLPLSSTQRAARWYRQAREKLVAEMGGRCATCARTEEDSGFLLEFDHYPEASTWKPEKTSRWVRLARYRREWAAGKLRLLCRSCNGRDGNRRRWHDKGRCKNGHATTQARGDGAEGRATEPVTMGHVRVGPEDGA